MHRPPSLIDPFEQPELSRLMFPGSVLDGETTQERHGKGGPEQLREAA